MPYKASLALSLMIIHSSSYGADAATFSNFYTTQWEWWHIAVASVFAVGAGVAVYFSAGAATPVVTSIGTFIGNLMGYSGVVATNAGLALLGGGAIASGGLGMAGGAAVITMALSFSTGVVKSYTSDRIIEHYDYSQFIEQSQYMSTLPLPRNTKGSTTYRQAITQLTERINTEAAYSSPYNRAVINDVIQDIKISSEKLSDRENIQIETLKALLYMSINKYKMAKKWAKVAIYHSDILQDQHSLANLIYAVSSLYEESADIKRITRLYFAPSVLTEPDNQLIPLMFSIYLDRIIYRFNDGLAQEKHLRQLVNLAQNPTVDAFNLTNLTLISIRYFTLLKLEQQKIRSLTQTDDITLKNDPNTLKYVKQGLESYKQLIEGEEVVFHYLTNKAEATEEQQQKIVELYSLYNLYRQEMQALTQQVSQLEIYQQNLQKTQQAIITSTTEDTTSSPVFSKEKITIGLLVIIGLIVLFAWRKTSFKHE